MKQNHIIKRILSIILTALLIFTVAPLSSFAADDGFTPVLRFIASSDSHVRMTNDTAVIRIRDMLTQTYDYSEKDSRYNNLDALVMAGDLTNDGTKEEFDKFWSAVSSAKRDETQFLGVVAKNHDGYVMRRKELRSYFSSLTNTEPDFHLVINGFHFIGLSASDKDGIHYSSAQLKWLKAQLDNAVEENPDKPVFFIHHEHNRDTVYGSSTFDGWGITNFKKILKNYPQVVDFSGHSHYPLNDPRSVWQGEYTAIGTGALAYSEFTIDTYRAYDPPGCENTATYWIVEVNAQGDMHLCGMDVTAAKQICEYTIKNPADKSNREFTPQKQKAASKAPVFADGTVIETKTDGKGRLEISVPAAQSADGMPVVLYRITVKNSLGLTVNKQWILPHYYDADGQEETITFELKGLPKGKYTASITAETAYGVQSEPLNSTITLDSGASDFLAFFRAILWPITRLIEITTHLF